MKHIKLFEQFISEKKSKSDYEDIIDKYESKIWELDNANASWIPTDSSKKEKMRQTFQKKIDAAQKALDKLDESLVNEARDITSVKRGDIIVHDETGKEYEVQDLIGKVHRLQSNKLRVVDMEGNVRVINPYKYSIKESLVNEARAPKTVDELKSALDDAYEKMNKYNEKYYSISKAPGGGSWSSNSKEGKAAAKYKKMANNQQANIWKWTDKLRKLGVEYISTNESLVNEAEKAKGDRGPLKNKAVETGLKNKAKESGVPLELLRLVMRRGMDAWNSSHYEGMTQEAWGYARVNAFLEKGKGTWGTTDADIAKEVRDGGHDKKLPYKFED